MLPKRTFVLGGAASGKSAWAENALLASDLPLTYIATGRVLDAEMQVRVDYHIERRTDRWRSVEAPKCLSGALGSLSAQDGVLIDCATMWLTNHMLDDADISQQQTALLKTLAECKAQNIVIVSNETGQGIVPENALARRFREAQGRLNIALAAQADLVVQVVAGLPLALKGKLP